MRLARLARRTVLASAAAAVAVLGLGATAALADDWGQRVPGQHVYDPAGALTPAQVSDLERSAAAVDQAGAPTVVYVRRKDADDATTRQDARALMDTWAVESSAGRKDGFVLLLNLKPADIRHGSTALVIGSAHADRLDDGRLQGIYDATMRSRLAAGDLAGAVSAALLVVARDMSAPEAPPSPAPDQTPPAGAVAASLLGLGAIAAVILGFGLLIARGGGWNRPPGGGRPGYGGSDSSFFTDSGASSTYTGGGGDGGASSGSSSGGGSF
ncbi:MAG: TPM domain-containing protein [Chloroflexi bacterium]|nr:MAG: TPM domain-containing protein [Chloroflexota bacterium]